MSPRGQRARCVTEGRRIDERERETGLGDPFPTGVSLDCDTVRRRRGGLHDRVQFQQLPGPHDASELGPVDHHEQGPSAVAQAEGDHPARGLAHRFRDQHTWDDGRPGKMILEDLQGRIEGDPGHRAAARVHLDEAIDEDEAQRQGSRRATALLPPAQKLAPGGVQYIERSTAMGTPLVASAITEKLSPAISGTRLLTL